MGPVRPRLGVVLRARGPCVGAERWGLAAPAPGREGCGGLAAAAVLWLCPVVTPRTQGAVWPRLTWWVRTLRWR